MQQHQNEHAWLATVVERRQTMLTKTRKHVSFNCKLCYFLSLENLRRLLLKIQCATLKPKAITSGVVWMTDTVPMDRSHAENCATDVEQVSTESKSEITLGNSIDLLLVCLFNATTSNNLCRCCFTPPHSLLSLSERFRPSVSCRRLAVQVQFCF